jgi:hypothetical protein
MSMDSEPEGVSVDLPRRRPTGEASPQTADALGETIDLMAALKESLAKDAAAASPQTPTFRHKFGEDCTADCGPDACAPQTVSEPTPPTDAIRKQYRAVDGIRGATELERHIPALLDHIDTLVRDLEQSEAAHNETHRGLLAAINRYGRAEERLAFVESENARLARELDIAKGLAMAAHTGATIRDRELAAYREVVERLLADAKELPPTEGTVAAVFDNFYSVSGNRLARLRALLTPPTGEPR